MHVLFITSNKKFLDESSEEVTRLRAMVAAAEVLHVIIFTRRREGYAVKKIGDNAWLYPTNSLLSLFYAFDAWRVIRRQIFWQRQFRVHVVHSDDPFLAGWLGFILAKRYERAWVINLHTNYWEKYSGIRSLTTLLRRVPASLMLASASHLCVFSERVRLYVAGIASTAQQEKILSFQKSYDPVALRTAPTTVDLRKKFSDCNFVILVVSPLHAGVRLGIILDAFVALRAIPGYGKAGLVVVGVGPLRHVYELRTRSLGIYSSVVFETEASDLVSYFKSTNLLLYLASSEEEDETTVLAAAAGCAIAGLQSSLMEHLIRDGENGIIVHDASVKGIVAAIRRYNEVPGLRERLKLNSATYLNDSFVRNDETLAQELQKAWTFEEAPPEELHLEHIPSFGGSTDTRSWWAKIQKWFDSLVSKFKRF